MTAAPPNVINGAYMGPSTTSSTGVDTLSLAGKVAIITGSGKENGIGAGIAKTLARNGAAVVINYVTDSTGPRAEKLAEEIRNFGGRVAVVQGSVETQESCNIIVLQALKKFSAKHVDILGASAHGTS